MLLGTAIVLAAGFWAFARLRPPADTIEPSPVIQRAIARAAAATSEAELQASLTTLRALGGTDYNDLIPQLVLYLMNTTEVRDAMVPGVIIDRLHITPAQINRALAPYRATSDPRLKQQIDNLLEGQAEGR